ncbi:MAG: peptidoglycan bridge formation glycyltransferase FemA/FemB family protein [Kouleothrix sp.]|jgi:lipid II:glycine glycyltransferase (peptidoglycan interpeptide bridge formation enzyme)|nr:peptidoglycan bridge formation glycyltransferase FemA/FemB family protein [Kouleothrix sp.]
MTIQQSAQAFSQYAGARRLLPAASRILPTAADWPTDALDRQLAIIEPDAASWDTFVHAHPHGHLLQSSGWARLKQRVGWQVRRVIVAGPDGPRAGAQLLIRPRLGLSAAYVPRGPLWADEASNALLLSTLDRLARRARAVFLRLEPNLLEGAPGADTLHSFLLVRGFQPAPPLQPRTSLQLGLAPAPERLLAGMSKGHRADIKRAQRDGVGVRVGATASDLEAFYTIMQQTGRRATFGIHSRSYYEAAWELLRATPQGECARLLLAERGEATLAVALVFAWAGTGLYLYGGSTDDGLKSGANHLLQWHALQWAYAQGCAQYDFWGVPDQFGRAAAAEDAAERTRLEEAARTDPLYGVFRFKKGFGSALVRFLPAYDRAYLPPLYALWMRRFAG